MRWLIWLAKQLIQHSETEFYIERMQPDWLPGTLLLKLYRGILAGLAGGLYSGVFIGVVLGPTLGLFASLFAILFCGLVFGIFGRSIGKIRSGLAVGLIFGLIFGLLGDLNNERLGGLLGNGLAGMGFGGLIGLSLNEHLVEDEIKPTETLKFSWLNLLKSFLHLLLFSRYTLAISVFYAILIAVISGLRGGDLIFDLKVGLFNWLGFQIVSALVGGIFGGISRQMMDNQSFVKPNQGIRNSMRYSIIVGMLVGSIAIMLNFFLIKFLPFPSLNISRAFILYLWGILYLALSAGGTACLAHFILRLLLWSIRCVPLNYPRFLDYTADIILLRKVGGGYIFVHRLLLEYFASLNTTSVS